MAVTSLLGATRTRGEAVGVFARLGAGQGASQAAKKRLFRTFVHLPPEDRSAVSLEVGRIAATGALSPVPLLGAFLHACGSAGDARHLDDFWNGVASCAPSASRWQEITAGLFTVVDGELAADLPSPCAAQAGLAGISQLSVLLRSGGWRLDSSLAHALGEQIRSSLLERSLVNDPSVRLALLATFGDGEPEAARRVMERLGHAAIDGLLGTFVSGKKASEPAFYSLLDIMPRYLAGGSQHAALIQSDLRGYLLKQPGRFVQCLGSLSLGWPLDKDPGGAWAQQIARLVRASAEYSQAGLRDDLFLVLWGLLLRTRSEQGQETFARHLEVALAYLQRPAQGRSSLGPKARDALETYTDKTRMLRALSLRGGALPTGRVPHLPGSQLPKRDRPLSLMETLLALAS